MQHQLIFESLNIMHFLFIKSMPPLSYYDLYMLARSALSQPGLQHYSMYAGMYVMEMQQEASK